MRVLEGVVRIEEIEGIERVEGTEDSTHHRGGRRVLMPNNKIQVGRFHREIATKNRVLPAPKHTNFVPPVGPIAGSSRSPIR